MKIASNASASNPSIQILTTALPYVYGCATPPIVAVAVVITGAYALPDISNTPVSLVLTVLGNGFKILISPILHLG